MELNELDERVRLSAKLMPTEGLRDSFIAIGDRADIGQSTDEYLVIHGYSMETISELSGEHGVFRSAPTLRRDLRLFVKCGIATKELGDRYLNNQPTLRITLYLGKELPADATLERREGWRAVKERAERKPETFKRGGRTWTTGLPDAPLCGCHKRAVRVSGTINGVSWARWQCAKQTHRCKFNQFA